MMGKGKFLHSHSTLEWTEQPAEFQGFAGKRSLTDVCPSTQSIKMIGDSLRRFHGSSHTCYIPFRTMVKGVLILNHKELWKVL